MYESKHSHNTFWRTFQKTLKSPFYQYFLQRHRSSGNFFMKFTKKFRVFDSKRIMNLMVGKFPAYFLI
eukprot:UN14925